jgi:hypothetical protein
MAVHHFDDAGFALLGMEAVVFGRADLLNPLQSKAGYIDARPFTASSTKTSCDARPDHTFRSLRVAFGGLLTIQTAEQASDMRYRHPAQHQLTATVWRIVYGVISSTERDSALGPDR